MTKKHFLFSPGIWIGEGSITFSDAAEKLKFYTRWKIEERESGNVHGEQHVEIQGGSDRIQNQYEISGHKDDKFSITLRNELVSMVEGSGVLDGDKIAWEFRGHPNFEGYEVYQLKSEDEYDFRAEYVSPDQLRSVIVGRIWKKKEEEAS